MKRLYPFEKILGSSLDCLTSNDDDLGCVSISPSSKLRRISLVKQSKGMSQSPNYKKTLNCWKDCENIFVSEDESSPPKSQRILLAKQVTTKIESPTKEKSDHKKRPTSVGLMDGSSGHSFKNSADDYCSVNASPSANIRRILLPRGMGESPVYKKNLNSWKDGENEGPPLKSQRISLVKRVNRKIESPTKENSGYRKIPASGGLVDACKELADLAVSRGSLDDITVMIIDLNHFGCNSTRGGLA